MYLKTCFCGDNKKNFKVDIGPGYMDKCCKEKGYNIKGELEDKAEPQSGPEAVVEESGEAKEDMAQAVEMSNEEAQSKKEIDFEGMSAVALMKYCSENDIKYAKSDTRKKLIEKIKKAGK